MEMLTIAENTTSNTLRFPRFLHIFVRCDYQLEAATSGF